MSVVWEEPQGEQPQRKSKGNDFCELLRPVMEHPKRWALVATYDKPRSAALMAGRINNRRVVKRPLTLPLGQWEATWRFTDDEQGSKLYVRYLGEKKAVA